jgi:spore coat polysaccharide biosynthesis protein SpsF (cytidylyltransferase family)
VNKHLFIQARLNSERLPRKVLKKLNGKYLLEYLIERIKKISNLNFTIATSSKATDDPIFEYCSRNKISCFRGPLEDVSKRMLDAATYFKADYFIRISGDSPLIDVDIINQAINIFENGNFDLVTNIYPRSFPVGQSVEAIRTKSYKRAYKKMNTLEHFEHVTKYYYENSSDFKIKNFKNNLDYSSYRLVVDSNEDFKRMSNIINRMKRSHHTYTVEDLIKIYPKSN